MADKQKVKLIEAAFARLANAVLNWKNGLVVQDAELDAIWTEYRQKFADWLERYRSWRPDKGEDNWALKQSLEDLDQVEDNLMETMQTQYSDEAVAFIKLGRKKQKPKRLAALKEVAKSLRRLKKSLSGCIWLK